MLDIHLTIVTFSVHLIDRISTAWDPSSVYESGAHPSDRGSFVFSWSSGSKILYCSGLSFEVNCLSPSDVAH